MRFAEMKTAGLKLFAALLLCAGVAHGQFIGYTAQQTTTQSLTIAAGSPTVRTATPLNNLGQASHTLVVQYPGGGVASCTTWLQASVDGTNWTTIASAPHVAVSGFTNAVFAYATGYYPLLRVLANANNNALCTGSITWTYVGYQFPITLPIPVYSKYIPISSAATVVTTIEYPDPILVEGGSCFNPNASTAYLQFSDFSLPPAAPGTRLLFETGIPAGGTLSLTIPIFAGNALSAAAVTTAGGSTIVGIPLDCTLQLNFNGPFGPVLQAPNSP